MTADQATGLPEYPVSDPALLKLSPAELRDLQSERLRAMLHHVHRNAPFWRRRLDAAGIGPDDITGVRDVARLPTCTKADLLADQERDPPFGGYTCTPPAQWLKVFTTSGTAGKPLRRVFSRRDWRQILDWVARQPPLTGPGEIVVLTTPVDAMMGATVLTDAVQRRGGLVFQAGTRPDPQKVEAIAELRPAVVAGSPSYLLHLADVAEGAGVDLSRCGVRTVFAWGEPGCAVEATSRRLLERFGAGNLVDALGMTELMPLGGNCPYSVDLHLSDDFVLVECLRPDRDEPVPPGQLGELTYTNLVGDTQPLLRYRSGDLGVLSDGSACACGSVGTRIVGSIQGRADDMIWYRGANIFPSAVEAVVRGMRDLGDEYRLVRSRDADTLTVQVEARARLDGPARAALGDAVAEALRGAIRERVPVQVLDPGSLPRADGLRKARRVVDRG
ncbi:AMP-binding protein [Spirillospora sp. NPDC049024]